MKELITKPDDIKKLTHNEEFFDLPPKKDAHVYFFMVRVLDLIVSITSIVLLFPVYILISLAILLEDGHSPIYVDKRLGKNKRPIRFFKFRSMKVNASELEKANKDLYTKLRTGEHKVKDHPYVTKVGKFLRKSSLDEIPQFFNVLEGTMSFVGPRALKTDEEKKFRDENPDYVKYLDALFEVKPGITGFWQVSGRSKIDFHKRIRMEAYYARTYSIINDILLIIKTPIAVLKAETH